MKQKFTFANGARVSNNRDSLTIIADECRFHGGYFILKNAEVEDEPKKVKEIWIKSDSIDLISVEDL